MWWMVAAQAASSILGGISEGEEAQKQAYRQAALDEFEARNAEETARENAKLIYQRAAQVRSTQVAQIAAAGVVVGDGSTQAAVEETEKLARQDAMAAMYTGARQSAALRAGASARKRKGDAAYDEAVTAGVMGAVNAGISGYAGSFKGTSGGGGSLLSGSSGSGTRVNNAGFGGLSSAQRGAFGL